MVFNIQNPSGEGRANLIEAEDCIVIGRLLITKDLPLSTFDNACNNLPRKRVQVFSPWENKHISVYAWCYYDPNASLAQHYRPIFKNLACAMLLEKRFACVQAQRDRLIRYDILTEEEYQANPLHQLYNQYSDVGL
jgi:hypothetical protein